MSGEDLVRGIDVRIVEAGRERGGCFAESRLAGLDLRAVRLPETDLFSADLRGADLAGADLSACDLLGCDLRGANLAGANLEFSNIWMARLAGANLSGARLYCPDSGGRLPRKGFPVEGPGGKPWKDLSFDDVFAVHPGPVFVSSFVRPPGTIASPAVGQIERVASSARTSGGGTLNSGTRLVILGEQFSRRGPWGSGSARSPLSV